MTHKTYLIIIVSLVSLITPISQTNAAAPLSQKLSGRFLLQVEDKGRCWYVNPANQLRYSLGSPSEALSLMRSIGIGISNENLDRINYDREFARKNSGKIFLQVTNRGTAWYVNPSDLKTYSLSSPALAFEAMRRLSLGITNANLSQIPTHNSKPPYNTFTPLTPYNPPPYEPSPSDIMLRAADAIQNKDKDGTKKHFIHTMHPGLEYSLNQMSNESLFILAGILRGAKMESSSETSKTYTNEVFFNGAKKKLYFHVNKQSDGTWKITNL